MPFHNPYTFIPAYPRDRMPEALRDARPPGHDRLRPDRWTGRIAVTMTTETPLLLLDTAAATTQEGNEKHLIYPVLTRDGRPHLPATSVKGMLRSAYEAITNSRFGVLDPHDEPLGFRQPVELALRMRPVAVTNSGELLAFKQAKVPFYKPKNRPRYDDDSGVAKHGDRVFAVLDRSDRVTRWIRRDSRSAEAFQREAQNQRLVCGIVFLTGENTENKKSERLFYLERKSKPGIFPIQWNDPERIRPDSHEWEQLAADWDARINSYTAAHSGDARITNYRAGRSNGTNAASRDSTERIAHPGEVVERVPGGFAWSPHLWDGERATLKAGTLCYALMDGKKVLGLYPVLVPRDVYPVAPRELLGRGLEPALDFTSLSPADRMFGWVAPEGAGQRPAAYRGRLRVGPVRHIGGASAVAAFENGLPLAILSSPKPTQGRFYLAESAREPHKPVPDGTRRAELYRNGRGLRGRKVYWHHSGPKGQQYWSDPPHARVDQAQYLIDDRYYREFLRPRTPKDDSGPLNPESTRYETTGAEQRDDQNRSIKGWVKPGQSFTFTIDVRNLETWELGALAWLLGLPGEHFHRLGFGKPLGFGSVRLAVDHDGTELHTGGDYADRYRIMSGSWPEHDTHKILEQARQEFDALIAGSEQLSRVRDAFLTVAMGPGKVPVHYPRTRPQDLKDGHPVPPDPRGRSFAWFTENERKGRTPKSLPGLPPPRDLPQALPIYTEDEDR